MTLILTTASAGLISKQARADQSNLKAYDIPAGRRGTCVQFNVRLVLDGKAGGANWPITLFETIGNRTRQLCVLRTDGAGWVRLQYQIPTNPNADNIRLSASFPGGNQGDAGVQYIPSKSAQVRVPITRG